jgi:hypothetical protein
VRNVKTRQNERNFGERRTEIQPFQFCSSHKTQCFFENCLFFYNQTATENMTKFSPKKISEHRLSDTLRKSKILNNALLHTTIFELFFWKFTYTWPIDLARCQIFAIHYPHDELFKRPSSVSRKSSEYFSHFVSKREFYDTYRCRCGNHGGDHLATVRITSRDKKEEKMKNT